MGNDVVKSAALPNKRSGILKNARLRTCVFEFMGVSGSPSLIAPSPNKAGNRFEREIEFLPLKTLFLSYFPLPYSLRFTTLMEVKNEKP